eukprot:1348101-Amphidinium_carterae.1
MPLEALQSNSQRSKASSWPTSWSVCKPSSDAVTVRNTHRPPNVQKRSTRASRVQFKKAVL